MPKHELKIYSSFDDRMPSRQLFIEGVFLNNKAGEFLRHHGEFLRQNGEFLRRIGEFLRRNAKFLRRKFWNHLKLLNKVRRFESRES